MSIPFSRAGFAIAAVALVAACSSSTQTNQSTAMPKPDPRVGLKAGKADAGEALGNLKSLFEAPSPDGGFAQSFNSDLAFIGNYAVQGNFHGPVIWDMSNPSRPQMVAAVDCPASQNDV